MKEKQFDYHINTGYAKNNSLSDMHVREGDKIIFEDDEKTGKIRVYQYSTRIFVGLVTQKELNDCIEY
ncbi:hypothetical protein Goe25_02150 [Bacillus phage vB_BsuM-Goe25]|nr:hypothetical protein [Bacillus phage BM-P1]WCS69843.1 hypothetical protein Goe25_02150 [Bacillus phage vB_BsuM-Goe25]